MSVTLGFVISDVVINRVGEALEAQGMRLVDAEVFFREMLSTDFVNETDWLVVQALDYAHVDYKGFDGVYVPPGVVLVDDTSRLGMQSKPRDLSGSVADDLEVLGAPGV